MPKVQITDTACDCYACNSVKEKKIDFADLVPTGDSIIKYYYNDPSGGDIPVRAFKYVNILND